MRAAAGLALSFVLVACSRPEPAVRAPALRTETVASSPAPAAGIGSIPTQNGTVTGPRRFGEAILPALPVTHLAQILRTPGDFQNGRSIRVEGTVVAVCQGMGCWMELRDETTQAHVRMHGHDFFVPRDIANRHAVVQATLVAAHPPTECDNEAREATGRVAAVELDATGVEVD